MFDAGSARALYLLDISQAKQAAAELRSIYAGLRRDAAALGRVPVGAGGGGGSGGGASAVRNQADAELRLSQQRARLAQITQGNAAEAAARAKWEALGGPAAFEAVCVAAYLATMPAEQAMTA